MNGERKGIAWWFTRGVGSLITIPVVLFLIVGCVCAFIQGGIQTLAYLLVLKAVVGFLGIIICLFVWPFSLLVPGLIWWAAIKEIPRVIQTEARTRVSAVGYFIAGLVFLVGVASGIQWVNGRVIGWIADRNPDAAFRAGVTGSRPPSEYQERRRDQPELSCHFQGQSLKYLGAFHDNHVYVDPSEDPRLKDGFVAAVFVAREDYLVLFRNIKDGRMAILDPTSNAKGPNDLEFVVSPPDAMPTKAWSIATGKAKSSRAERGRDGRECGAQ